jgi:hypothetical protein
MVSSLTEFASRRSAAELPQSDAATTRVCNQGVKTYRRRAALQSLGILTTSEPTEHRPLPDTAFQVRDGTSSLLVVFGKPVFASLGTCANYFLGTMIAERVRRGIANG